MAEQEDFNYLKFLHMLLAEEKQTIEEVEDQFNIARLCYKQIADPIIENNHIKFIEFMERIFSSFNINLDANFQEGSLVYVKKSLSEITDTIR